MTIAERADIANIIDERLCKSIDESMAAFNKRMSVRGLRRESAVMTWHDYSLVSG